MARKTTPILNGFENVNGEFAHDQEVILFHNVFNSHLLQRLQNANVWSKGLFSI